MNSIKRAVVLLAAAALLVVPALALAAKPTENPGRGHDKAQEHAKAYGKYCQGESKKHVKGEKGTAFSRCVKAMHKAVDKGDSPKAACKGLSRKHVKGEKGTPHSRCVVAAAHAKKDAADDDGDDEGGPTGPTGEAGEQS
jgi:hypothetical protein